MASPQAQEESISSVRSPTKITKRKIHEALQSLDDVLRSPDDGPTPAKKARFPSSLYSTLAKYGIKTSKEPTSLKADNSTLLQKTAPHLSAILSRAASRKRKPNPVEISKPMPLVKSTSKVPGASEYRPSSTTFFLSRLSTFKLSTYSNKPPAIDAVAAAKAGWVNDGKDRLVCGICRSSWVVASRDGMARDAAYSLLEKQRASLIRSHKDGCPWREQQCDSTIYCIPLKPPSVLAKEIKKQALDFDEGNTLDGIDIRHPLTSSQVLVFMSSIASVRLPIPISESLEDTPISEADLTASESNSRQEPSQTSSLTALFGWALAPPSLPADSRSATPSFSRSSSVAPSLPGTPRRVSSGQPNTPSPPRPAVPRLASAVAAQLQRREGQKEKDSALLYCKLCQRKVGLWAFKSATTITSSAANERWVSASQGWQAGPSTPSRLARRTTQLPKRQFDLLKEHRSYCPYVARSTTIPSLPSYTSLPTTIPQTPPSRRNSLSSFTFSFTPKGAPAYPAGIMTDRDPNMIEGWRAVLTVVCRTGLSHRQRLCSTNKANSSQSGDVEQQSGERDSQCTIEEEDEETMEVDGIQAMVEDVKSHGGKDLLQYVRSLFA